MATADRTDEGSTFSRRGRSRFRFKAIPSERLPTRGPFECGLDGALVVSGAPPERSVNAQAAHCMHSLTEET